MGFWVDENAIWMCERHRLVAAAGAVASQDGCTSMPHCFKGTRAIGRRFNASSCVVQLMGALHPALENTKGADTVCCKPPYIASQ